MTSPTPDAALRTGPRTDDAASAPAGRDGWRVVGVCLLTAAGTAAATILGAVLAVEPSPGVIAGLAGAALLAGVGGAVLLDRRAAGAGSRVGVPAAATAGLLTVAALTVHLSPLPGVSAGIGRLQTVAAGAAALVGAGALASLLLPRGAVKPRVATGRLLAGSWRVSPVEAVLLAGLAAGLLATTTQLIALPVPLGHDESVYGVQARTWLTGAEAGGVVAPHRAPLLSAIGIPAVLAGGTEWSLRLTGVGFGIVALIGVWMLGRAVGSPAAGLLAAGVFVFAPTVLDAAGLYLTDLPAAALLVAATAVLWHQFEIREAPSRWLLAVAPLAAGAFYLRYGSALVIVLLGVTALALWWRRVVAAPGRVGATAGLFVLLLVPHAVNATAELGAPWARVLYTSEVAGRDYLGHGLVEYLQWWPDELAGTLGGVLAALGVVAGAVAAVAAAVRRPPSRGLRGYLLLVAPAVGHIVLIGLAAHGDPRFVFYAVALLVVAGCLAIVGALRWTAGRIGAATAAVGLLAGALLVATSAVGNAGTVLDGRAGGIDRVAVLVAASERIASEATGSCSVLTSYGPQVTWYSRCGSESFGSPPQPGRQDDLEGHDRFLLLLEGGKRQPEGDVLEEYLREAEPVASWTRPGAALARADLYRF